MSASDNNPSSLVPHENQRADRASNQDPVPADLIALERERVKLGREVIAANERENERQFKFNMKFLEYKEATSRARHKTSTTIIYVVGFSLLAALVFFIYNVFYGDIEQKESALIIIKYLAIAIAGYGVIGSIARSLRKFMRFKQEEE